MPDRDGRPLLLQGSLLRTVMATILTMLASGCEPNKDRTSEPPLATTAAAASPAAASPANAPLPAAGASKATRECDLGDPHLLCSQPAQACDTLRGVCVDACSPTDGDCCSNVACPAGSGCVPDQGRCGLDLGDGCYDMGIAWWTGRDRSRIAVAGAMPSSVTAQPVRFEISNSTGQPLYFETIVGRDINFRLFTAAGTSRALSVSANHYCANPCPASGLAAERDCEPPTPVMRRLPAEESFAFEWSGEEQLATERACGPSRSFCWVNRATMPGRYAVELCAYPEAAGGQAADTDRNYLLLAVPAGNPECDRFEFDYPTAEVAQLRFTDAPR